MDRLWIILALLVIAMLGRPGETSTSVPSIAWQLKSLEIAIGISFVFGATARENIGPCDHNRRPIPDNQFSGIIPRIRGEPRGRCQAAAVPLQKFSGMKAGRHLADADDTLRFLTLEQIDSIRNMLPGA